MSADALPISPARFGEAIKELSLASLLLKTLEIRNSIAHLDYSNEQLRPFAEGTEATLGAPAGPAQPDQDCIDAIRENEQVAASMQARIRLIRAEVERRGCSWAEFQSKEELEAERAATNGHAAAAEAGQQGANGPAEGGGAGAQAERHSAWSDGTFQTGTIRNGEVHVDGPRVGGGGSLTDEQLRRALELRLREDLADDDDDDEGMHL